MRLVFAGTPEPALPALDALAASAHEVVAVVTRPDARAGRGRSLVASPVRRRAEELGLPVLAPARPSDPDFQDLLRELEPDVCPVVAYGALLPTGALAIPRHGWVNLHFSVLPAWRGAAPVQHALMAGEELTGASTFLIEAGLDTGPVYGVMTERIRATDTSGDLLGRLATGGAALLVATMDGIADGSLTPKPQSAEGISLAPKVQVDDARVRWDHPAAAVDRLVRGCTPAPGAWTVFRGERLKLAPVALDPDGPSGAGPGEVVASRAAVHVGTATGPVRLGEVQPHGKKLMPAPDWARGLRIGSGERMGEDSRG